jgi:hypothetical protein
MGNNFEMDETTSNGEPTDDVVAAASTPKSMTNDEGTVVERSVKELIDAKEYEANNNANLNSAPWGIRVARTPRGSTT